MADQTATIKVNGSAKSTPPGSSAGVTAVSSIIDSVKEQVFDSLYRVEKFTLKVPASSAVVLTPADFGITQIAFVKIECVSPGKTFNLDIEETGTAVPVIPPNSTDQAFFMGNVNFSSAEIANSDAGGAINFIVSLYMKAT